MKKILALAAAKALAVGILMGVGYYVVMHITHGTTITDYNLSVEGLLFGLTVFVTMLFPYTFFGVENARKRD